MQEYIQVIIDAFPGKRLPRQQLSYSAIASEFRDNFDRNSTEYQELFNFYIAHLGKPLLSSTKYLLTHFCFSR